MIEHAYEKKTTPPKKRIEHAYLSAGILNKLFYESHFKMFG